MFQDAIVCQQVYVVRGDERQGGFAPSAREIES
jgi:hypothetical protein